MKKARAKRRSPRLLILRDCLPAAAVLLALLAFTLWYAHALSVHAERWTGHLDTVERYARAGEWDAARSALEDSRADWTAVRPYLQAASRHDAVDQADALYGRCTALAEAEAGEGVGTDAEIDIDKSLLPDLAELRRALADLADMEKLCLRNIL
ncbi:MAG: DUF4363 family protein [Oscillibacter sp.]|nr:DUF4363 family protein [Oscillibacter sp.]